MQSWTTSTECHSNHKPRQQGDSRHWRFFFPCNKSSNNIGNSPDDLRVWDYFNFSFMTTVETYVYKEEIRILNSLNIKKNLQNANCLKIQLQCNYIASRWLMNNPTKFFQQLPLVATFPHSCRVYCFREWPETSVAPLQGDDISDSQLCLLNMLYNLLRGKINMPELFL